MLDKFFLAFLAAFLILFGLFTVTNLVVEFGRAIMGACAIVAGILAIAKTISQP